MFLRISLTVLACCFRAQMHKFGRVASKTERLFRYDGPTIWGIRRVLTVMVCKRFQKISTFLLQQRRRDTRDSEFARQLSQVPTKTELFFHLHLATIESTRKYTAKSPHMLPTVTSSICDKSAASGASFKKSGTCLAPLLSPPCFFRI